MSSPYFPKFTNAPFPCNLGPYHPAGGAGHSFQDQTVEQSTGGPACGELKHRDTLL
jgi:hypothetical protein